MLTADKLKELKAGQTVLDNYDREWRVVGEWPVIGAVLDHGYRILDVNAPFRVK